MGSLLEAVKTAEKNIERLADPEQLRAAADQVMTFARSCGARSVVAASPVAERLVGAMLAEDNNLAGLTVYSSEARQDVLIVDINLASGTSVAQAARSARLAGAEHVHAVVLHQVTAVAVHASDCGVDALKVLGPMPTGRSASSRNSGL